MEIEKTITWRVWPVTVFELHRDISMSEPHSASFESRVHARFGSEADAIAAARAFAASDRADDATAKIVLDVPETESAPDDNEG